MTHWAGNYATVGGIRVMSTQVTESRMKSAVKTPARKTNNQASFGGSLLKNNMEVEAAMELQRHLDETGVHIVCTIYVVRYFSLHQVYFLKTGLLSVNFLTFGFIQNLHGLTRIYTEFTLSLRPNRPFSWGKPPVGKM